MRRYFANVFEVLPMDTPPTDPSIGFGQSEFAELRLDFVANEFLFVVTCSCFYILGFDPLIGQLNLNQRVRCK